MRGVRKSSMRISPLPLTVAVADVNGVAATWAVAVAAAREDAVASAEFVVMAAAYDAEPHPAVVKVMVFSSEFMAGAAISVRLRTSKPAGGELLLRWYR